MEPRKSKEELLQIFERRFAKKRQRLEKKQRHLEEQRRRLAEEQHQLEREWQRFNEAYEAGQKFINDLWADEIDDETDDGELEFQLEEIQGAPIPQQQRLPSQNGTSRRSVSKEVLAIVDEWQDDLIITQREVTQKFLEKRPDRRKSDSLVSAISHTLSQLASSEDGELELVEKGAGSRPSKYRKRAKQKEAENLEPESKN